MSTAYHPQTDGQIEVVNKCLECYLRCMSGERPKKWVQWLSLAEYWYNTNKHSSINVSPNEAIYGQTPPLHNPYVAGESVVEIVDISLHARESAIEMLKFHIKRQVTIRQVAQNKLSHNYYGPFLVLAKVGKVAYKLDLPSESQVHPVFHMSQLKSCKGNALKMGFLPHCREDGLLGVEAERILDRRIGKLNNKAAVYVLVKWFNHSEEDATWEIAEDVRIMKIHVKDSVTPCYI
ncbi:retrotransposable element Tf2 [Tanacetum coccineum]